MMKGIVRNCIGGMESNGNFGQYLYRINQTRDGDSPSLIFEAKFNKMEGQIK